MARARNIKPALYQNEDLAECSIWARYIFPGLWCLADREGRLEDRPKRIKAALLPFDTIDVEPLLEELEQRNFIVRYQVAGIAYIDLPTFKKHQAPHGTEKDSLIPGPDGFLTVHPRSGNGYITGEAQLVPCGLTVKAPTSTVAENSSLTVKDASPALPNNGAATVGQQSLNALIPDSLIPDSLIPELTPPTPLEGGGKKQRGRKPKTAYTTTQGFDRLWLIWPSHPRKGQKGDCVRLWVERNFEPLTDAILAHVGMLKKSTQWTKDGGEYIPAPLVYLRAQVWEGADLPTAGPNAPQWVTDAGFTCVAEASNSRCYEHNAENFRDGRRLPDAEVPA
ncbi:MAG: hypothetical protein V4505_25690 [Pseudomonadota bacterium]